jgi:dTDP-4-amino-4,6-dideoxygalactose transaminase
MMAKLAMFGGTRTVTAAHADRAHVGWPVVTDAEREAALRVLDSGRFTSNSFGKGEVQLLEDEWAQFVGSRYCAAVSNGTAALSLAVAALGLEPGTEILVPALSFIASAIAPVHRLLVPRFVDIDPATFNMDPVAAEAAITPRTSAILVVHLHGLPADLAELREIADRHGLRLIEDAAQSHGATYRGRHTGTFGDLNTFSLNTVKNLPTCGEGGLVNTDDEELHRTVVLYRQFGEDLTAGRDRDYVSQLVAGNEKMSAMQAAFTRAQLARLPEYMTARERNVSRLLGRLAALPGLVVPTCPPDRTHAWHILRFRFDPVAAGLDGVAAPAFRAAIGRALKAEGVGLQPYQLVPLPQQKAFTTKLGLGGYPWRLTGVPEITYRAEDYPQTVAVIADSLTLQRWHLNPQAGPVLELVADAFEKVWENMDSIAQMTRARLVRAVV